MKSVNENNKMIAEFMGWKMIVQDRGINIIKSPQGSEYDINGLRYHSSWDWIMPVVHKIDRIMINEPVVSEYEEIAESIFSSLREVNIPLTYIRIVEFVEKYHQDEKRT